MVTTKRQLSFYAESDVDLYLSLLDPGSKTRSINDAIKAVMLNEAKVDLNDGQRPVYFRDLTELQQNEVHSNLILEELNLNDVDGHIWEIVRETASRNWKENTARYLALHETKFGEPFRIARLRSQEERDNYRRENVPRTRYYCEEHTTKTAEKLLNLGDLEKCGQCGAGASFREYK